MDSEILNKVTEQLTAGRLHSQVALPNKRTCVEWLEQCLSLLFRQLDHSSSVAVTFDVRVKDLIQDLATLIVSTGKSLEESRSIAEEVVKTFPDLQNILLSDAEAIFTGDPAAQSVDEVILTYPGFFAIAAYRIAHALYNQTLPLLPRIITEHAHRYTGIDINPGARIGHRFMIDHGTGVVIGETAVIGNNVILYQGVTLGGFTIFKAQAGKKRHPTLEDNVVVYANATILGGDTIIGASTVVGGNVWLTESVPAHSRVYYRGAIEVSRK